MERRLLRGDYSISRVVKGGWQLAGGHGAIEEEHAVKDMFAFVDAGITTFDCADIYTGVEALIGKFRGRYKERYGEFPSIEVHTKCVPDLMELSTLNFATVESIIERSRERLGVVALDLVQFHWWDFSVDRYVEAASYLHTLQQQGKVRRLGVTNFDTVHLKELVDAGIPIVSNQVQYSVLDTRPEKTLVPYCKEQGIALLCYGTVAGGFIAEKYLGAPEPTEFENRSLLKYKCIIDEIGGWATFQDQLRALHEVAQKHNASIAEIASASILDKPGVAGVLVGARNATHLRSTQRLCDITLDENDRGMLRAAQIPMPGEVYGLERQRDGKHGSIMKYDLNSKQAKPM